MNITKHQNGEKLTLELSGEINEAGGMELKNSLSSVDFMKSKEVELDMAGVTMIGSSGIGKILLFYKELTISGGRLSIVRTPNNIKMLFKELKFDTLFPIS